MLAHPALHDAGDGLRGALNVDPAVGIPHWRDLFRQLAPEGIAVRQPHNARAADRTLGMPGELREQRAGLGPAAEEQHIDALAEMLVHQGSDKFAALDRVREAYRCIE